MAAWRSAQPPGRPGDPAALRAALSELRALVVAASPDAPVADTPAALAAAAERRELLATLDDLLLPRLLDGDNARPVLTVVAGPTGAGKSTLVNSLVRAQVSVAGVLRPTTYSPVLVCHPSDRARFSDPAELADLRRVSAPAPDPETLLVVSAPTLPAGLALLDAPDVDSVAHADRGLAGRLLAAADLWLFVTTADRYADAVAWRYLDTARDRDAALVVVVDRVPPSATTELGRLVGELLAERGLAGTPVFVVPEAPLDRGLLSEFDVVVLRDWLDHVAVDAGVRSRVIARTVSGAVRTLPARVEAVADIVAARDAELAAREHARAVIVEEELAALRTALVTAATPPHVRPPSQPAPTRWWRRARRLVAPAPATGNAERSAARHAVERIVRRVAAQQGQPAPLEVSGEVGGEVPDELPPPSLRTGAGAADPVADVAAYAARALAAAGLVDPAPSGLAPRLRAAARAVTASVGGSVGGSAGGSVGEVGSG